MPYELMLFGLVHGWLKKHEGDVALLGKVRHAALELRDALTAVFGA